jgi:hypothetical protein
MMKIFESVNSIGLDWGLRVRRKWCGGEIRQAVQFATKVSSFWLYRIIKHPSFSITMMVGLLGYPLAMMKLFGRNHQHRWALTRTALLPVISLLLTVWAISICFLSLAIIFPVEIFENQSTLLVESGDRMLCLNRWLLPIVPIFCINAFLEGFGTPTSKLVTNDNYISDSKPGVVDKGGDNHSETSLRSDCLEDLLPTIPITVVRRTSDERYDFIHSHLTLDYYHQPQVHGRRLSNQADLGYIQILDFNDRSLEDVNLAISQLCQSGSKHTTAKPIQLRGLVVDLRGNTGGSLLQALEIAASFLKHGASLLQISDTFWYCNEKSVNLSPDTSTKLLILVDHLTASAAEVLCEALNANKRAAILGTTTYGKNTAQVSYIVMPVMFLIFV